MRIAILGSVSTKIPPASQAAIERLAYQQALGLAKKGHRVLLFALEGSNVSHQNIRMVTVGTGETLLGSGKEGKTPAEVKYGASYKLRLEITNLANTMLKLIELKEHYDTILNNLRGEAVFIPLMKLLQKPFFHVMHLPLIPQLANLFREQKTQLISISNAQRKAFPDLNYVGTVYNAVDTDEFTFSTTHKNYLLYVGSIGRNKNPRDAVLAAKRAGEKLLIGGRIKDQSYYDTEITPHIDGKQIEWIGEKHPQEMVALYQGAKALLFPTLWEEPFGLIMIEAMSCGTPVIAYANGAVPEVVRDGVTGFIVEPEDSKRVRPLAPLRPDPNKWIIKKRGVEGLVEAVTRIGEIDRRVCRRHVEEHFTIIKMIDSYEKILVHTR